jgi:hypothetical protein
MCSFPWNTIARKHGAFKPESSALVVHGRRFCARQAKPKGSRHHLPVEFLNHLIHLIAKELVYFAEAALGVEGGVVEVVALEAERRHDVVADELKEGGLALSEFFLSGDTGVFAHDPGLEVAADGVAERRELGIAAAGCVFPVSRHELSNRIHRVLHKNSLSDFLFRNGSKIAGPEDEILSKSKNFWKLIEEGERARPV